LSEIGPTELAEYPVGIVVDTVTVLLLTTSPLLASTCGSDVIIVISYSYKMFIEPASKVSVPFTVVTWTLSNTPPKVITPQDVEQFNEVSPMFAPITQILPDMFVITISPVRTSAAPVFGVATNPVVDVPLAPFVDVELA
jgi:hypothetical protein